MTTTEGVLMDETKSIDSARLVFPACGWRTDQDKELNTIKDVINLVLKDRKVGTFTVTVEKSKF